MECSLPINLFTEKFFIFLWFWITLVLIANVGSLISWLCTVFSVSRVAYVKKYLKLIERAHKNELERKHIRCFAEEYLRHDGIFYLRMLASNTNEVIVAQVVSQLWNHYNLVHYDTPEYHKRHRTDDDLDFESGAMMDKPQRQSQYGAEMGNVYKRRQAPPIPDAPPHPMIGHNMQTGSRAPSIAGHHKEIGVEI